VPAARERERKRHQVTSPSQKETTGYEARKGHQVTSPTPQEEARKRTRWLATQGEHRRRESRPDASRALAPETTG